MARPISTIAHDVTVTESLVAIPRTSLGVYVMGTIISRSCGVRIGESISLLPSQRDRLEVSAYAYKAVIDFRDRLPE